MEIDRKASIPLYKQIYSAIKEKIISGEYKESELLPSERDLCTQFDVERITVRKSLEMLVNEGFVEKIPGLGTRVKSIIGDTKDHSETRNIVFVLPEDIHYIDRITEPFNASIFFKVEKECNKRGYNIIYSTAANSCFWGLHENISGIMLVGQVNPGIIEEALDRNIPAVLVNNCSDKVASVMADNQKGAYNAVKYLLEMGHKNIGIILGEEDYCISDERFDGYKLALSDWNIDWRTQIIKRGDWSLQGGYNCAMQILQEQKEIPDAIFASSDIIAFGAIEAIKEVGLRVPKDISVIGFDDIEQCKFMYPYLSTVSINLDMLIKASCFYLFNAIDHGQALNIKITVPTELVIRNTVKNKLNANMNLKV